MGGIKHQIDETANEILAAKGIARGVGSDREMEEGERLLAARLASIDLTSDRYDQEVLEDYARQGVYPGPEYFE